MATMIPEALMASLCTSTWVCLRSPTTTLLVTSGWAPPPKQLIISLPGEGRTGRVCNVWLVKKPGRFFDLSPRFGCDWWWRLRRLRLMSWWRGCRGKWSWLRGRCGQWRMWTGARAVGTEKLSAFDEILTWSKLNHKWYSNRTDRANNTFYCSEFGVMVLDEDSLVDSQWGKSVWVLVLCCAHKRVEVGVSWFSIVNRDWCVMKL